jgi:hypothetical protein
VNRFFDFLERFLEPAEQLGEVLFGLMMVLVFTLGAGSLVSQGEGATRDLLLGVLGCNVAWGVIQGWMYMIDSVFERSHNARLVRLVQQAPSREQGLEVLRDELDSRLEDVTSVEARTRLYGDIYETVKNAEVPYCRVRRHDLHSAIVIFGLVMATTLPALVPFLFISDLRLALRVSNLLLVGMLFLAGFRWASLTNTNRWRAGFGIMLGAVAMVGIAEALGG